MRILRLSVQRLHDFPGAETAAEVAQRFAEALRAQRDRGVAHVAVSQLGRDLVELAVFLEEDHQGLPEVGDAAGWVVSHGEPGQELW